MYQGVIKRIILDVRWSIWLIIRIWSIQNFKKIFVYYSITHSLWFRWICQRKRFLQNQRLSYYFERSSRVFFFLTRILKVVIWFWIVNLPVIRLILLLTRPNYISLHYKLKVFFFLFELFPVEYRDVIHVHLIIMHSLTYCIKYLLWLGVYFGYWNCLLSLVVTILSYWCALRNFLKA